MTIADKTLSIKEAGDEQLLKLMRRLRNETEVQELIRRLRANSKDRDPQVEYGEMSEYDKGVDLSTPIKDLYHFGIKGQKWGVRRGRNVAKKHGSETKTQGATLSDSELRSRISRLQLEQQYAQLTAPQKSEGRKFVEGLLKDSGKEVAKDFVVSVLKAGTKGPKEAAITKLANATKKKKK